MFLQTQKSLLKWWTSLKIDCNMQTVLWYWPPSKFFYISLCPWLTFINRWPSILPFQIIVKPILKVWKCREGPPPCKDPGPALITVWEDLHAPVYIKSSWDIAAYDSELINWFSLASGVWAHQSPIADFSELWECGAIICSYQSFTLACLTGPHSFCKRVQALLLSLQWPLLCEEVEAWDAHCHS